MGFYLISIYYIVNNLDRVKIGSSEHILPMVFFILAFFFLSQYSRKKLSIGPQWKLIHLVSCGISIIVLVFHLHKILFHTYDLKTDLPLYLCSLLALIIPVFTHLKKYWMFEILVFWVLAGTLQAIATPDIAIGFPSFDYFRYWIVHLGLLFIIGYIIVVFGWQPKFKSIFKSFLALQLYIIMIVMINKILDANYFYLNKKPESTTLLDYLGEWPYYIIAVQILIIPYFILVYLPFYLLGKKKS